MTVINGIEIDDITYIPNDVKKLIRGATKIEDKLHVIIVLSNPCQFARRYILAREFVKRCEEEEPDVELYVVELAYGKHQQFHVTEKGNPKHLQLKTNTAFLWHKENMINIGVRKLLPASWKAFAWVDADVAFDSPHWASDTLKLLNGSYDVLQLFSHAVDMDARESAMSVFSSFGFQYAHKQKYGQLGVGYFHPGFAWAITRTAYDQLGGLYETSILGSGDNNMALSFIGHGLKSLNEHTTQGYKDSLLEFQDKAGGLKLGYVPGAIRHFFHGAKKNRKYSERWKLLVTHEYDPGTQLAKNKDGLLVPTPEFPIELLYAIHMYFQERNEDEGYLEATRVQNK